MTKYIYGLCDAIEEALRRKAGQGQVQHQDNNISKTAFLENV